MSGGARQMEEERRSGGRAVDRPPPELEREAASAPAAPDEIVLPLRESYDGLSRKVLLSLRWALEVSELRFSFLLKTDDDAFVCTGALLSWLHRWRAGHEAAGVSERKLAAASDAHDSADGHSVGLYAGARLPQRCIGRELIPLFDSALGEAYRDSGCARGWRFPRMTMAGAGYVLSRDLVERVVRRAYELAPVPSAEDATVSLLLHWQPKAERRRETEQPTVWQRQRGAGEPPRQRGRSWQADATAAASVPLPFEVANLHVIPFANRRNAQAKVEKLRSLAEQLRLVKRRCSNPNTLVLHKLNEQMLHVCAACKALANVSCTRLAK